MANQKSRPRTPVEVFRPGIVPGLAGSVAMFIGMGTYETDWYITVLFAISILAAIMTVFSFQSMPGITKWVFVALYALITIYWNPIFRLNEGWDSGAQAWLLIQTVAAATFFVGGFLVKTPATPQ